MPWHFLDLVMQTLRDLDVRPLTIIQGGARGADTLAKVAAIYDGHEHYEFPADWATYGKKAGHLRNQQMLDQNPDLVIAFHPDTGITPGTRDMVTRAQTKGTPVKIVTYPAEPPR
jgi:hypothetical protein